MHVAHMREHRQVKCLLYQWGVENKIEWRTYSECSLHEGCLNLEGPECGLVTIAVEAMQVTCAGYAACNSCQVFFEN